MSILCFTAKSNNEGFENPFPDGLESESFIVYVIARAYDRSGAYANGSCQVVVCSPLNKNLNLKMRFMILQLVWCRVIDRDHSSPVRESYYEKYILYL